MSHASSQPEAHSEPSGTRRRARQRGSSPGDSLLAQGESMIWLSGGALAIAVSMIVGLILLVVSRGAATFWPSRVIVLQTLENRFIVGEQTRREPFVPSADQLANETNDQTRATITERLQLTKGNSQRRYLRVSSVDSPSSAYKWVSEYLIEKETQPEWMLTIEQYKGGRIFAEPNGYQMLPEKPISCSPEDAWKFYLEHHANTVATLQRIARFEKHDLGAINAELEAARLKMQGAERRHGKESPEYLQAAKQIAEVESSTSEQAKTISAWIEQLKLEAEQASLILKTAQGDTISLKLSEIVRAFPANRLTFMQQCGVYVSRWWEFLTEEPREKNTEGGVMPAIFGTVAMTLIMSLMVAPFGVLASLYLREYAQSGVIVSLVRIAINNLSGVPSIVFGVFGFGFFCCQIGAFIDGGPENAGIPVLPPASWYLLLLALAVIALIAFLCSINSFGTRGAQRGFWQRWAGRASVMLWLLASLTAVVLIARSPFFAGFFTDSLPDPTFGTAGILWSACTLALLTLPVVITATEEALSAVPNSLREGSYACGAGKWQTIHRIVLPHAMPGIMTGMILALSRGAGEVAPLMLVGATKYSPNLPIDGEFPFVHAQRSFMHLAYHIFDLGFHSEDSEASKPMVFTTMLLLIAIITLLNSTAVWLRSRLRKKFQHGQF